jgi:hypothetical protein
MPSLSSDAIGLPGWDGPCHDSLFPWTGSRTAPDPVSDPMFLDQPTTPAFPLQCFRMLSFVLEALRSDL